MDREKELLAVGKIKDIQQYFYDPSINRSGLDYGQRLKLTQSLKRGTCTTKHEVLAWMLKQIGLDAVYLTFPFFWQELPVDYPEEISSLLKRMPQQNHLALGLVLRENQKILDVTWDPLVARAGFVVPQIGSEIVDMPLAVVPFSQAVTHTSIEERAKYLRKQWELTPQYEEIRLFYATLARWLFSLRTEKSFPQNFGQVNDTLYRGSWPSEFDFLAAKDIDEVVTLFSSVDKQERKDLPHLEEKLANLGIRHRIFDIVNNQDLIRAAEYINKSGHRIYVHCKAGANRTSMVCLITEVIRLGPTVTPELVRQLVTDAINYGFDYHKMKYQEVLFDILEKLKDRGLLSNWLLP